MSFRAGYGIGGGVGYDPNGTSPDPCNSDSSFSSIGAFAEGNLAIGPLYGGANINGGVTFKESGEISPYTNESTPYGITPKFKPLIRGSLSAGIEYTHYF